MKTVLCYIRFWLDRVVDFMFSLYWNCKKEVIPDLEEKHAFLAESATTLARKIRERELKSEDLVRAVIDRIKQVIFFYIHKTSPTVPIQVGRCHSFAKILTNRDGFKE